MSLIGYKKLYTVNYLHAIARMAGITREISMYFSKGYVLPTAKKVLPI